ncbi:DUF47 family protein [bacterium]|mgnify:CR=1 FL=1|jgi:predicted phosphate transport protein (TIGR00153 family)|nr:DUF47 family protein [bacterium]MBT3581923.1 DUF47 family protein [bacterium]MBT4551724.1 DUF47 family protein [bacterium]MBT5988577.1 DUF47 family protein [bacterium]MBT7088205.1 DUF47 family protein [bacterium]
MFDKYFGFLNFEDEYGVIESFIEHGKIGFKEVCFLVEMVDFLCENEEQKVVDNYRKIKALNKESTKIFQDIMRQIIESDFDYQKQYDLLRIYQRTEGISDYMIASAKRILIFEKLDGKFPAELSDYLKDLVQKVKDIYMLYMDCLNCYIDDKKCVLNVVDKIENLEHEIDGVRSRCLEVLYKLANEKKIALGDLRVLEEIVEHIEEISDVVEEAGKSVDWLLLKG